MLIISYLWMRMSTCKISWLRSWNTTDLWKFHGWNILVVEVLYVHFKELQHAILGALTFKINGRFYPATEMLERKSRLIIKFVVRQQLQKEEMARLQPEKGKQKKGEGLDKVESAQKNPIIWTLLWNTSQSQLTSGFKQFVLLSKLKS